MTTASRVALAVLCLAPCLIVVDAEGLAVALPAIRQDLDLSTGALQWIVSANLLAFGGFLLLGGRAADQYGRLRTLTAGLALFAVAALAAGLAPSAPLLLAARALQGLGAALAMPAALSLLTATFADGPARNRALAVYGTLLSAGLVTGVAVGGLLTQALGWRALLLLEVPLATAALVAARRLFMPAQPPPRPTGTDLGVAAAATAGLVAVLYAATEMPQAGSLSTRTALPLLLGLLALAVAFLRNRRSARPLLPPRLLQHPTLGVAATAALCTVAAGFGTLVVLSLYLQEVRGYSPLAAGLLLTPLGVAGLFAGRVCPWLMRRLGLAVPLAGALVLQGVGIALMIAMRPDARLPIVLVGLALMGAAHFGATVLFTALGTTAVPPADHGIAAGVITSAQQLGGGIGLALLVTIASSRTAALHLPAAAPTPAAVVAGFQWALAAGAALSVLPAGLVLALRSHIHTT